MEKSLEEFLRQRGVPEDVIDRMKTEKIDVAVIHVMDDVMLQQFLPFSGDRVMLKDFCRRLQPKHSIPGIGTNRRDLLMKRIRRKLEPGGKEKDIQALSSSDEEEVQGPRKKVSKPNASRAARQIEIGWLHKVKGVKKPFRQKQGGGTRKVTVPKVYKKGDILLLARNLFFPDGTSTQGPATELQFDVLDFQFKGMDDSVTVGDFYEASKLPLARFYLVSESLQLPPSARESAKETTAEQFREDGLPNIAAEDEELMPTAACTEVTLSPCSSGSYWVSAGTPSVFFKATSCIDSVTNYSSNNDVDGVHDQHREVIIPHHSGWLNTLDTSDADCLYQNTTVAISHAVPEVVVLNECEGEFETGNATIEGRADSNGEEEDDVQVAIMESLLQPTPLGWRNLWNSF